MPKTKNKTYLVQFETTVTAASYVAAAKDAASFLSDCAYVTDYTVIEKRTGRKKEIGLGLYVFSEV